MHCRACDTLLNDLGGGWDDMPEFPAGWMEKFSGLRKRALEIHRELAGSSSGAVWGWKDPRASLLLPFWLVSRAEALLPEDWAASVQRFGVLAHLESFQRGVLDSADILYFVVFTFIFLFLTFRSLESRRWR